MNVCLARTLVVLTLSLLSSGCDVVGRMAANRIFGAQNKIHRNGLEFLPEVQALARQAAKEEFDVAVRGAKVRVALVPPGQYELLWNPHVRGRNVWIDGPVSLVTHTAAARHEQGKGVIVMLHGFGSCKEQLLPWAIELANDGYWIAMVDLRGHGASTGDYVSFGALERDDLSRVVDALQQRGFDQTTFGVMGVSYGASVALNFAGSDPRVATVVAFEPFSSAQTAIPELAHAAFPEYASQISDKSFSNAFALGAARGGFDWSKTNVLTAIPKIQHPLLFIHGAADTWLKPEHSQRLYSAAVEGSRLMVIPNETHVSLPLGIEKLRSEVRDWFDRHLDSSRPQTKLALHQIGPGEHRTTSL